MKKYIVTVSDKKYIVKADDVNEAVRVVNAICLKDEASPLQTVEGLKTDEIAAVAAYNVAIENLKGKIPEESLNAIITIRDDENRHIENLQAIINGNVTEKNLKDAMTKDDNVVYKEGSVWKLTNRENYNARVQNANQITKFEGMTTRKEVEAYITKYMGGLKNIQFVDDIKDSINDMSYTELKSQILSGKGSSYQINAAEGNGNITTSEREQLEDLFAKYPAKNNASGPKAGVMFMYKKTGDKKIDTYEVLESKNGIVKAYGDRNGRIQLGLPQFEQMSKTGEIKLL